MILDIFVIFIFWGFLWIFRGRKYINIKIVGYLMNEKNQNNFYKIYIYILDFLAIFSEFSRNFSSQKNHFLDISGIDFLIWALSRPVGIFSVFFTIFLAFFRAFWHIISFFGNFCQNHFWAAYVSHQNFLFRKVFPEKEISFFGNFCQMHFWVAYVSHQNFLFW